MLSLSAILCFIWLVSWDLGGVVVGMSSAPAASAAALSGATSQKARKKQNDLDISKKQEIALFLKQLDNDRVKKTFQEVADLFSPKLETDIDEAAVRRPTPRPWYNQWTKVL